MNWDACNGSVHKTIFYSPSLSCYVQRKVEPAENTFERELQSVYTLNTVHDGPLYVHAASDGSRNKEIL